MTARCARDGDLIRWERSTSGDFVSKVVGEEERSAQAAARAVVSTHPHRDSERPSQATRLLRLAATAYELYQSSDGEPFVVRWDGPPVALPLRGGRASLRAELAHRYAQQTHRAPSAAALTDVLAVLEGQALTALRRELSLRLARSGGSGHGWSVGRIAHTCEVQECRTTPHRCNP